MTRLWIVGWNRLQEQEMLRHKSSGWQGTLEENAECNRQSYVRSPEKTIARSLELGVRKTMIQNVIHKHLRLCAYKLQLKHEQISILHTIKQTEPLLHGPHFVWHWFALGSKTSGAWEVLCTSCVSRSNDKASQYHSLPSIIWAYRKLTILCHTLTIWMCFNCFWLIVFYNPGILFRWL
jgi:hypothetical protein